MQIVIIIKQYGFLRKINRGHKTICITYQKEELKLQYIKWEAVYIVNIKLTISKFNQELNTCFLTGQPGATVHR